ncbi:MAG: SsrA-binding protein SmpB [Elusimicrobia bacterium]|nr:SsrA-binding protein SmpB [Elusimicrobiota bacterium]
MKVIAKNRRAEFRYHILEVFDGGLVLTGPEVKSLRAGQVTLEDGFGRLEKEEVYLWNVHIAPYKQGSLHVTQEAARRRKVLLHREEIKRILGKLTVKGLTLVPLEIYFSDSGFAKVKLGLAKGKTGPDKREDIKRKDVAREMRREFSGKQRI